MENCVTYSWTLKSSEKLLQPIESDYLPSEIIDDCYVYVQFNRNLYRDRQILSVCKTNFRPIIVDIAIQSDLLGNLSASGYEWRDCCKFLNIACPPNLKVNIICNICWTIPEEPALVLPAANFLMSSPFSDVIIVIENEELPAHKVILGGYSSVFCQMLSTPMKEAETSRIAIEDIDVDTMKTVLTFLYKGKCEALWNASVACKAFAVAHKYDIPHLQETCLHNLCELVNVKNVVEILELAHLYEKGQLINVCWKFVMKHLFKIISTVQFKDLCAAKRGVMDRFTREVIKAVP